MMAGKFTRPYLANLAPKYQSLLDDIESTVAPYRHTFSKPGIPLEEMVVVAVCFNPDRPGTSALKWLVPHFRYYQDMVNFDFSTTRSFGSGRNLRQDFFDAVHKLDVPIMTNKPEQGPAGENRRLVVDADKARVFLGPCRTEPTTPFRFMNLSPEIRNTIYEMALSFPKTGINIRKGYKSQNRVHALTKDNIMSLSPLKRFATPTDYPHNREIALQGRT
ncbi:hypothetical protein AC579_5421 [Pseudocercospora musae]|uniref:Uncharacterized protein n=1 Tax=Pseudocercospora musae TaxID=113226 RepID=A0A139H1R7_9PEZI|nr:hypothetical protein AC579_5421 [Pseudocercospora musae]